MRGRTQDPWIGHKRVDCREIPQPIVTCQITFQAVHKLVPDLTLRRIVLQRRHGVEVHDRCVMRTAAQLLKSILQTRSKRTVVPCLTELLHQLTQQNFLMHAAEWFAAAHEGRQRLFLELRLVKERPDILFGLRLALPQLNDCLGELQLGRAVHLFRRKVSQKLDRKNALTPLVELRNDQSSQIRPQTERQLPERVQVLIEDLNTLVLIIRKQGCTQPKARFLMALRQIPEILDITGLPVFHQGRDLAIHTSLRTVCGFQQGQGFGIQTERQVSFGEPETALFTVSRSTALLNPIDLLISIKRLELTKIEGAGPIAIHFHGKRSELTRPNAKQLRLWCHILLLFLSGRLLSLTRRVRRPSFMALRTN